MTILPRIGRVNPGTTSHACADDLLVFSNPPKTPSTTWTCSRPTRYIFAFIDLHFVTLPRQPETFVFFSSFFSGQDGNGNWTMEPKAEGMGRLAK